MAKEIENPTLDDGGTPEVKPTDNNTPANDVESLIAELEKVGITKPEELQGKLEAGTQAGQLANLLGETRAELRATKEAMEAMKQTKPYQENEFDQFEGNQTTDLEGLLTKVLDKREKEKSAKALQAQQAVMGMWNEIQTDPDYHLIKDVWEQKIKDPTFVYSVQIGQTNPVKEFNKIVREHYKGTMKRSLDTIKTLTGKSDIQPPHVEEGGPVPDMPTDDEEVSEHQKKLNELDKKLEGGKPLTEEDELDAIQAILRR